MSPLSLAEKGAQQEGSGGFAMEGCGGRLEQAGRATCYFYMLFLHVISLTWSREEGGRCLA